MAIEFGNYAAGTFPAARPLRASGNVALLAPKFFLGGAEPSRIVYDFGIAGYREGFQANVDANGIVVLRQRFAIQDRGKAGVPLAVFILESERFNFALERTMQLDFSVANLGIRYSSAVHSESCLGIRERVKPALALEARKSPATLKECLVRLIYTVQHILQHLRIHLAQRRVGFLAGGQLCRLHGERYAGAAQLPSLAPLFESIVVQLAAHFQRRKQDFPLFAVWPQPIFIRSSDFRHMVG